MDKLGYFRGKRGVVASGGLFRQTRGEVKRDLRKKKREIKNKINGAKQIL